jgi:membrane associated rhomboid family serine protease
MEETANPLQEIARSASEEEIHEYGLVVLSQRAPYWVAHEEDAYLLLVGASRAEQLQRQVDLYREESLHWPPVSPEISEPGTSPLYAAGWMLVLFLCHGLANRWPEAYELGRLSSAAVMEGEVYRCLSALFLHADIGHLTGNMLFGAVFLHFVARQTGGVLACLLVLLSGTLGNFLNAWVYFPVEHYSIGASTAVFGAIGILVSLPAGFMLRHASHRFFNAWAMPFVIGLVFLAWFGTGSEQTDTSAHLLGFAAGLPLGVLGGWISQAGLVKDG